MADNPKKLNKPLVEMVTESRKNVNGDNKKALVGVTPSEEIKYTADDKFNINTSLRANKRFSLPLTGSPLTDEAKRELKEKEEKEKKEKEQIKEAKEKEKEREKEAKEKEKEREKEAKEKEKKKREKRS